MAQADAEGFDFEFEADLLKVSEPLGSYKVSPAMSRTKDELLSVLLSLLDVICRSHKC